jgi:hypothetical protein
MTDFNAYAAHCFSYKRPPTKRRFDVCQPMPIDVVNPPTAGHQRRTLAIMRNAQPTYSRLRKLTNN